MRSYYVYSSLQQTADTENCKGPFLVASLLFYISYM